MRGALAMTLQEFGGCEGVGGDGEGAPEWEEGMYNEALVWAKNMPNRIQYLSSKTQQVGAARRAGGGSRVVGQQIVFK